MKINPGYAGDPIYLSENSKVVDIGSGHNPLSEATLCIERDVGSSDDRGGRVVIIPNCDLMVADVETGIPLPSKSFDFVHASHILEHMKDPISFCDEMGRIGNSGYIETPNPIIDYLHNDRTVHRWYIFKERNGGLIFIEKRYTRIFNPRRLTHLIDILEYNVFFPTRYHWQSEIKCRMGTGMWDILFNAQIPEIKIRIVPDTPIDRILCRIFGDYKFLRWRCNR